METYIDVLINHPHLIREDRSLDLRGAELVLSAHGLFDMNDAEWALAMIREFRRMDPFEEVLRLVREYERCKDHPLVASFEAFVRESAGISDNPIARWLVLNADSLRAKVGPKR